MRTHFRREWLCPDDPDTGSFISSRINYQGPDEDRAISSVDATLTMADCNRSIDWDFSLYTYRSKGVDKEIERIRAKARLAKELLDEFFVELERALKKVENNDSE